MEREQILASMADPDHTIRARAATEAGKLAEPPVAELVALLRDANLFVRHAASRTLASMGNAAPIDAVVAIIREVLVTGQGIEVTHAFFASRALQLPYTLLIELADGKPNSLQSMAMSSIGKHYLQEVPEAMLLRFIQGEGQFAAKALRQLGTRASDELLVDIVAKGNASLVGHLSAFPGGGFSPAAYQNPLLIQEATRMLAERGALSQLGPLADLPLLMRLQHWQMFGIAPDALPAMVREGLAHRDMGVRAMALQYAINGTDTKLDLSPDEVMAALLVADDSMQFIALEIVGAMQLDASIDLLLTLVEHPRAKIRQLTLQKLIDRGTTLPHALMQRLLADPQDFVRDVAVVSALPHVTIEPLIAALDNWHISDEVIARVAKLGEAAPIDILLRFLREPFTTQFNASRLGKTLAVLAPHLPLAPLLDALASPHPNIRAAVIQVLGTFGERAPLDALVALASDPDRDVRAAVIEAAIPLRDRFPLATALAWLDDPDEFVRRHAINLLGAWQSPEALTALLQLFAQGQRLPNVITALAEHHDRRMLTPFLALWRETAARMADKANTMWGNEPYTAQGDGALPPVSPNTQLNDLFRALYDALIQLGDVTPWPLVQALLVDTDWRLRCIALDILADTQNPAVDDMLVHALEDVDMHVQAQASEALRRRGAVAPAALLEQIMLNIAQKLHAELGFGEHIDTVRCLVPIARLYAIAGGTIVVRELLDAVGTHDDYWHSDVHDPLLALHAFGERLPVAPLLASFTSDGWFFNTAVPYLLAETHPTVLASLLPEARSIILKRQTGEVLTHVTLMRAIMCLQYLTPFPDALLHVIVEALDHPNAQVRRIACNALAKIRPELPASVLLRLEQISQGDESSWTQRSAQTTLQRLRKP